VPLTANPIWIEKEMNDVTIDDLAGVDVLVHLAAGGVSPQISTWDDCYRVNVIETLSLVSRSLDAGVRRIIASGTFAEYGLSGLRYNLIPPNAPLEAIDPYGASKASASIALYAMAHFRKCELMYYRLFSVFGEGQFNRNFWPSLRNAALAGEDFPMTLGEQIRDFIPVEDVVSLLLRGMESPLPHGVPRVLNLGSGKPQSLRAFAEYWWKEWGATGHLLLGAIPYREGEVMRYVPEI
jgi:nucleoside-diphosphate-sugar epimerase